MDKLRVSAQDNEVDRGVAGVVDQDRFHCEEEEDEGQKQPDNAGKRP